MKRIGLAILLALVPSLAFGQVVNWGDYLTSDSSIQIVVNTTGNDGVAETIASEDIVVVKDATTVLTTGFTLDDDVSLDFGGGASAKTGLHKIVLDATTSGYDDGDYAIVYKAGTVDSVSVANRILAVFSIGRYADIDATNGVVQANIKQIDDDATAAANSEAFFDGTGYAGTGNTIPTVTTTTNVTTVNGLAANVITAASIAPDAIGASEAAADLGADLASIPWNASWDAEVQSEADDALIAKGLDHLVSTAVTGADVADNSIVAKMVSKNSTADWDSYNNTTDSLEAIRDNAGGGVIEWTDLVADNDDVAGSFGKAIADILVDTGTSIPDAIGDVLESVGISREEADMIAARVNAHRGTFYPNEKQVWVLKRGTAGLEVKNSFQISKGAGETLRVYIDFASVMGRNEFVESIENLELTGGTASIVADSEGIVGNLVYFDVEGGAADDTTTVEFEVLSTEDQTISGDVCEFNVVE